MITTIIFIISIILNIILAGVTFLLARDFNKLSVKIANHIHRVQDDMPKTDSARAKVMKLQNELAQYIKEDAEGHIYIDVFDEAGFNGDN